MKKGQNKGITCERSKENKAETWIRVFGQWYVRACKGLRVRASGMRAHTLTCARMPNACVRRLSRKP